MANNAIIVEPSDNVVVAIESIKRGDMVTYVCGGETCAFPALEDITIYHKAARCDIAADAPIVKYGQHIGIAAREIQTGEHVHVHNVASHRENLD